MFCSISIDDFVKNTVKNNKDINKKELQESVKDAVKAKRNGAKCICCGNTIWAVGTSIVGWNGCFACITGETDTSEDYEIDEVCY